MKNTAKERYSWADYSRFIVPSVMGILLLMFPFQYQGETTITAALFAGWFTSALENKIGRASCRERV